MSATATMVHFRAMNDLDMSAVLEIEEQSFDQPWVEENFVWHLRQPDCFSMVAEYGDKIVGFMVYEVRKRDIYIINFAVHAYWRRTYVGTQMATKLITRMAIHGRLRIRLYIRETNLMAQLFFSRQGFLAIRVRRHFYRDSDEDAFLMEYHSYQERSPIPTYFGR